MTTLNQHDQPVQTMVANLAKQLERAPRRRRRREPAGAIWRAELCASVLAITVNGLPGPVYWAISRVHA
jgi:hypothetical protein